MKYQISATEINQSQTGISDQKLPVELHEYKHKELKCYLHLTNHNIILLLGEIKLGGDMRSKICSWHN